MMVALSDPLRAQDQAVMAAATQFFSSAFCVNQTVIAVVNYEERLSACVEACCGSILLDARKGYLLVGVRWSYRGFKATSAPLMGSLCGFSRCLQACVGVS